MVSRYRVLQEFRRTGQQLTKGQTGMSLRSRLMQQIFQGADHPVGRLGIQAHFLSQGIGGGKTDPIYFISQPIWIFQNQRQSLGTKLTINAEDFPEADAQRR